MHLGSKNACFLAGYVGGKSSSCMLPRVREGYGAWLVSYNIIVLENFWSYGAMALQHAVYALSLKMHPWIREDHAKCYGESIVTWYACMI